MSSLRSRIHHPFLVVGRTTATRPDYLQPALTAARTSGALLLLPYTVFDDLSAPGTTPAREALAKYPAQLAVAKSPAAILDGERRAGIASLHYTDDDAWRRLRRFLEQREAEEPAPPPVKAKLPSLAEESLAEVTAGGGATLPERLASPRTTRLVESALRRWGCESAVASKLASSPSFAAHYLLAQIASALLPPAHLDPVDLATIACGAISLDYVTDHEDARALFQDLTLAVDLRAHHSTAR